MKTHLIALSVGVVALVLMSTTARAQDVHRAQASNCAAREAVIDRLASRYGESRQSVGVAANQSVVEVYANDATGSWSILVTLPNGTSCLVASGMSFEALASVAPMPQGSAL
ncbi:MAG: hypothetical protein AAF092_09900 [Pseudomonadota bacterium]